MVKFNKEMTKKERRKIEEQQVAKEEPVEEELENKVEEETAEEAKPEEAKTEEFYETEKGEAVLKYDKSKEKGYCQLRERTKDVYGIKYAAGKGVDLMKKAKSAIMDWCLVLHKKGPQRKDEEELM
ncbi:hypothetical protein KY360_01890 [Candidatus Woesearchaeota archaeon]|nr:hypothetical protein [Candidatus Woesearchaeota archaeon]